MLVGRYLGLGALDHASTVPFQVWVNTSARPRDLKFKTEVHDDESQINFQKKFGKVAAKSVWL